jgi:NurA domain
MALNIQQVVDRIREIASGARARREALEKLRQQAFSLLNSWADKTAPLRDKVERARQVDPSLRCGIPLDDALNFHSLPGPVSTAAVTLIAADGSQIVPDRHAALLFGLINVGAVVISGPAGQAPQVLTDSQLSFDHEVVDWTDGLVALQRDLAERRKLLAISREYSPPLVTLTDGPLQLWEARESNEVFGYEKALDEYLSVLSQLQERGALTAGYVDKPSSNLLVRLLEVALTPENELAHLHELHPLAGVSDLWLFDQLLRPGERSAVFALQARSKAVYQGPLALHFFYLNVGQAGHPKSARVEIPAWVAQDKAGIDQLHAALLEQCAILGARPYPYILHRAHESAVVTFQEKQHLEQLLELEIRKSGGEPGEISGKQAAKDSGASGRKRYK